MAIELEFIDFIVPIKVIREKYPGGWVQCLIDHELLIGGRVWYDEHLFRNGAMNPLDIDELLKHWKTKGLNTHEGGDNPTKWLDVCVVEGLYGGTTTSCDWIEVDGHTAYWKYAPKGDIKGRNSFKYNDPYSTD